jgi:hypothetical protein
MLTGFINPNQPFFSLMNTDRANFLLDGPSGTGTGITASARANALYTRGDVLAGGRLDLSGSELVYGSISSRSTITAVSSIVASTGQVRVNRTEPYVSNNNSAITIDPTLCQVFQITFTGTLGGATIITSSKESEVKGGVIYILVVNTDLVSDTIIDFNANFRTENVGAGAGRYTITANTTNSFCFFCDGTNFYQMGKAAIIIAQ